MQNRPLPKIPIQQRPLPQVPSKNSRSDSDVYEEIGALDNIDSSTPRHSLPENEYSEIGSELKSRSSGEDSGYLYMDVLNQSNISLNAKDDNQYYEGGPEQPVQSQINGWESGELSPNDLDNNYFTVLSEKLPNKNEEEYKVPVPQYYAPQIPPKDLNDALRNIGNILNNLAVDSNIKDSNKSNTINSGTAKKPSNLQKSK